MFRIYISFLSHHEDGLSVDQSSALRYDDHKHDDQSSIDGLLFDACESLYVVKQVLFFVEGFGQSPWPVDVHTDMLTFIEQVPGLIEWLTGEENSVFNLDFYEQGIQRFIILTKVKSNIIMQCMSMTEWSPKPETESMNSSVFGNMICNCVQEFVHAVEKVRPDLYVHPRFQEWCNQKSMLRCLDIVTKRSGNT